MLIGEIGSKSGWNSPNGPLLEIENAKLNGYAGLMYWAYFSGDGYNKTEFLPAMKTFSEKYP